MVEKLEEHPAVYLCSLSGELMTDPVLDQEGNSYQRSAIEHYLTTNQFNPHDKSKPLRLSDLIPNKSLKNAVEDYLSKNNINPDIAHQIKNKPVEVVGEASLALRLTSFNDHAMISLVPPITHAVSKRTPLSICAVIDVSGSMGSEANIGKTETYGFTVLDLVKHALRTIVQSLGENDSLALVKFDSNASVQLKITKMNEEGKKVAENAVDALRTGGSTNIWAGLETGLNVIRDADVGNNVAVLLLTDGQPTDIPQRGHLWMLQNYRQENGGRLPAVVHTFGFGNNLDSRLLNELATEGNGAFAFIPDGSFVGTVFVNAIANLLNTFAAELTLSLKGITDEDVPNMRYFSQDKSKIGTDGLTFQLGSITFGQSMNFVLPKKLVDSKGLEYQLSYFDILTGKVKENKAVQICDSMDTQVEQNRFRIDAANIILDSVLKEKGKENFLSLLETLIKEIESSLRRNDPFVKDLLTDLKVEVKMAMQEFTTTWGKHYLLSIGKAHLLQFCNNFKDPGVQHYAGERFTAIRDLLDSIFLKFPAPVPSIKRETNVVVNNMSHFYNVLGVCFSGDSVVQIAGGLKKLVRDVRKGDYVVSSDGNSHEVVCTTKMSTFKGQHVLVELDGGLKITPWHPVLIAGNFEFPRKLREPTLVPCDAVYNFVLKDGHLMNINGIDCVTLGHNFKEGVAFHEYFGSERVINDLKGMKGWDSGIIFLNWNCLIRDETSGLAIGITQGQNLPNLGTEEEEMPPLQAAY